MKPNPLLRAVPWLVLLLVAFALGRWQAGGPREAMPRDASPAPAHPEDLGGEPDLDTLSGRIDDIISAARRILHPDARTLAFVESLSQPEAIRAIETLAALPPGNESHLLLLMVARRAGELDGEAALAQVARLTDLPLRAQATAVVYEAWGTVDASAAFARALADPDDNERPRALTAMLVGAAAAYAGGAVTMWEGTPADFRESAAGHNALDRIVDAACGTGQREAVQAIILGLPEGEERARLTAGLARNWGLHEPEEAVQWLKSATPPGALQDAMIDEVFSAYVRKNPARAAEWGLRQTDERRRSNYIAAAVAEWATLDTTAAETWINEQPAGSYLDGASYAIAAYFIERRRWPQAFAWTRRINRNEARADLLGNIGRIWNAERPEDFQKFLDETSLNRVETEMLRSKIVDVASP